MVPFIVMAWYLVLQQLTREDHYQGRVTLNDGASSQLAGGKIQTRSKYVAMLKQT